MRMYFIFIAILFFMACKQPQKDIAKEAEIEKDFRPKVNNQMSDYKYITSVKKKDEWYFINERNEKLFDKSFTYASYFSDGLTCVSFDGVRLPNEDVVYGAYYTAMDKQGNFVEDIVSDLPFVFRNGRTIISYGPSKKLINKSGEVIREDALTAYGEFHENKVAVFKNGKVEYWDVDGNVVIGPEDFTTQNFSEDRALVKLGGKFGYIDGLGKPVIPYKYEQGRDFREGFAVVVKDSESYFIDSQGKEVHGPFQKARDFEEGRAAVLTEAGWNFIDKDGTVLYEESFSESDDFSEGIAIVKRNSGALAMLRSSGEVMELDARVAMAFQNGLAIAERDLKMGYINTNGEWVIDPEYQSIHDFFTVD